MEGGREIEITNGDEGKRNGEMEKRGKFGNY